MALSVGGAPREGCWETAEATAPFAARAPFLDPSPSARFSHAPLEADDAFRHLNAACQLVGVKAKGLVIKSSAPASWSFSCPIRRPVPFLDCFLFGHVFTLLGITMNRDPGFQYLPLLVFT